MHPLLPIFAALAASSAVAAGRGSPAISPTCQDLAVKVAEAAAADPEIDAAVGAARVQGKAMSAAADAIATTTGGMAGGLAAELLRAQAAGRVAAAERRQMAEIDRSSKSLDVLDAQWERAGCE